MQLLSYVPLGNSMDHSLPESSVYGIFQARILEQVVISYSRGSSWPRDPSCISFGFSIGRQILYHWATWKPHLLLYNIQKPSLNLIPSEYIFQKFEISPLPSNAGDVRDVDLIPGWKRSPGGRKGDPLQYSCLENPMERGMWWATVPGVGHDGSNLACMQHKHHLLCFLLFSSGSIYTVSTYLELCYSFCLFVCFVVVVVVCFPYFLSLPKVWILFPHCPLPRSQDQHGKATSQFHTVFSGKEIRQLSAIFNLIHSQSTHFYNNVFLFFSPI